MAAFLKVPVREIGLTFAGAYLKRSQATRRRDEILAEYLVDNVKARRMMPDGSYKRAARGDGQVALNSQEILLGIGGLFVVSKAKEAAFYFRTCVVAAVISVVCFGAWWWTEVMYDLQVIHSQPRLTGPSTPVHPE